MSNSQWVNTTLVMKNGYGVFVLASLEHILYCIKGNNLSATFLNFSVTQRSYSSFCVGLDIVIKCEFFVEAKVMSHLWSSANNPIGY